MLDALQRLDLGWCTEQALDFSALSPTFHEPPEKGCGVLEHASLPETCGPQANLDNVSVVILRVNQIASSIHFIFKFIKERESIKLI